MRRVLGLLVLLSWAAGPHWAGAQRVQPMEAVGTVGAPENSQPPELRERATRDAVMRAALRVAYPLLDPEALAREPIEPGQLAAWLRALLGDDPLEYASRFRILEDRGVRPALFRTRLEMEYVVVVEAHVDVDRVRDRLASRGLLLENAPDAPERRLEVVAELDSFQVYRAFREVLEQVPSVAAARPLAFERGQARLEIESYSGAETLMLALLRESPPRLVVEALGVGSDRLRVRVAWRDEAREPAPADPAAVPGEASEGNAAGTSGADRPDFPMD